MGKNGRVVIKVAATVAACDCGETSEGTAFTPENWARLFHSNKHTHIYVEAVLNHRDPRVEAMKLEAPYGDDLKGWSIKEEDGRPVLYNAEGARQETTWLGTNWRDRKTSVMSLRVSRPNAPKVEIDVVSG